MQIKTIKDYYDLMYLLFPTVPKTDIQKILSYGWKLVYLLNSYGGDMIITDNKFWSYIGTLRKNSLHHYYYYVKKLITKLRVLYKRKKIEWNGYYYFALTEKQYENYLKLQNKRGRPRKTFNYGNQILYKLLDECKLRSYNRKYIFKVFYPVDIGFTIYKENFNSDNAELIITRNILKFKDILVSNKQYEFL